MGFFDTCSMDGIWKRPFISYSALIKWFKAMFWVICIKDFLLTFSLFVHTKQKWAQFDMRGNFVDRFEAKGVDNDWEMLCKNLSIGKWVRTLSIQSKSFPLFQSYADVWAHEISHNLLVWINYMWSLKNWFVFGQRGMQYTAIPQCNDNQQGMGYAFLLFPREQFHGFAL